MNYILVHFAIFVYNEKLVKPWCMMKFKRTHVYWHCSAVWRWRRNLIQERYGMFYIFTSAKHVHVLFKKILSHEWRKVHNQRQNHWFFCYYIFFVFQHVSFNLRHCLEYMTWRHKILLFSHCENFQKCENDRLWRCHTHLFNGLNPVVYC